MHAESPVSDPSVAVCLQHFEADTCNRRYKGKKINYDVDECAQPYPQPAPKLRKEAAPPRKFAAVPNRFHLLNIDDGEEDEIASAFQSKKAVGIAV